MCLQGVEKLLQRPKSNAEGPLNAGKMTAARSHNESKRFFQQPLKPALHSINCGDAALKRRSTTQQNDYSKSETALISRRASFARADLQQFAFELVCHRVSFALTRDISAVWETVPLTCLTVLTSGPERPSLPAVRAC